MNLADRPEPEASTAANRPRPSQAGHTERRRPVQAGHTPVSVADTELITSIIDRLASYVLGPPGDTDPVISLASPQALTEAFAETVGLAVADHAEPHHPSQVLAAVDQIIEYSMHTSHPRFVNQNFAGPDPIAVMGDWLAAALNTTAATYEVAPVFTLMENTVLHALAGLVGHRPLTKANDRGAIPPLAPGLFCAGGSMGTLLGLQLARHRHQPELITSGAGQQPLALFVSDVGHYSAVKSAALLGIGTDGVVKVETDRQGRMIPEGLQAAIDASRAAGREPFAVIGTAGTTVTAAFDDLHALADICHAQKLWFHVDACYGGSALFSLAEAGRLAGIERSDSCVWNLHKMLGITQQCTALLVKDPAQLAHCFAAQANYLFQPDKLHHQYDAGDRTFMCGRRVDVVKAWLAWKVRGRDGFAARIDHAVAVANHGRARIAASGGAFVPVVAGTFTNVVFVWVPPRWRDPHQPLTLSLTPHGELDVAALPESVRADLHDYAPQIKAHMQAEGSAMIGFSPVHGINAFRLICISPNLHAKDVDALLATIDRAGQAVDAVASR